MMYNINAVKNGFKRFGCICPCGKSKAEHTKAKNIMEMRNFLKKINFTIDDLTNIIVAFVYGE